MFNLLCFNKNNLGVHKRAVFFLFWTVPSVPRVSTFFSIKYQIINIPNFEDHMISVPTTQLCPYPVEAATDSIYKLMDATVFQEKFIHNRQQVRFVLQAIICKLLVYTTPSLVPLTKLKITQLISQLCAKSQLTTEVVFVFFSYILLVRFLDK